MVKFVFTSIFLFYFTVSTAEKMNIPALSIWGFELELTNQFNQFISSHSSYISANDYNELIKILNSSKHEVLFSAPINSLLLKYNFWTMIS